MGKYNPEYHKEWYAKNRERLDIDHCHKTNKVRGLLCNLCNQALGLFKDNKDFLEKAINYLKNT